LRRNRQSNLLRSSLPDRAVWLGGLLLLAVVGCSGATFTAGSAAVGDGGDAGALAEAGSGGTLAGGQSAGGRAGAHSRGGAGSSAVGGSSAGSFAAASSPGGSAGDAAAGDAGSAGTAGSGGTLAEAGSGGAAGEAGACAVVAWFPDGDNDAYGRTTAQVLSCDAPKPGKWVTLGGDCNDDSPSVSPAQKDFRASGYVVSSGVSFDYDCSGKELADPTQLGAAPACASLGVLNCAGSGFAATARNGPGVNPLCGSTTLINCAKSGLNCLAVASQVAEGVRCR